MTAPRNRYAQMETLIEDLQIIVDLAARVVHKFPRNTLPAALIPFVGTLRVLTVRTSARDNEFVVQLGNDFQTKQVRIPADWLTTEGSQITAAVRDTYWGDLRRRQMRERTDLVRRIENHEAAIAANTRDLERARASLKRLEGRLDKPLTRKVNS